MDLPFTPTFFKKIDIFQMIKSWEQAKKDIWIGEKSLLIWAVGGGHQHTGESIGEDHVLSALNAGRDSKIMNDEQCNNLATLPKQILNALVQKKLADSTTTDARVVINSDGFLAGDLLVEINGSLGRKIFYNVMICYWWLLFIAGGLLLILQIVISIQNIIINLLKITPTWGYSSA